MSTPYATSPVFSTSEEEMYDVPHGLPLYNREPCFSPLQETHETRSSYPDQVVPDTWITETPPSAQPEPEAWSPPSAQPGQDMDDIKLPPHVLEHLDNSQLSAGYEV